MDFREALVKILQHELGEDVTRLLEVPPDPRLGDFALPCFFLAQKLQKDPSSIARELQTKIHSDLLERVEAKGPYVNFFFRKSVFATHVLNEIFTLGLHYGGAREKKKILFEYPSPNTNKPLHLGHVRNIVLGQSLVCIHKHVGHKVIQVNLNNDRGVHICKSMLAYQKWGKNKKPNKKSDHYVGDFYVLYNRHETPELEREVQQMLQLWEDGDKKVRALWKKLNTWALKGFAATYKKFSLRFDKTYYESAFYDKGKKIIEEGLKKDLFFRDADGSVMVDLGPQLEKKVLLRADGTSIYITQDIYLATLKFKDFHPDLSVYIVGSEQDYHFQVLFKVLDLLQFPFAKHCYHLSYGMVYLPEGKMKSREGTVVDADDLIEQMEQLAEAEVRKRHQKLSTNEIVKRSQVIGMGALRFFIAKMDPAKDMLFNPKESIAFEGETGPYVQYAYARIRSILRKHGKEVTLRDVAVAVFQEEETRLISLLEQFPRLVQTAVKEYNPSVLAHYLIMLTQHFNRYYDTIPILKEREQLRNARLGLITAIATVLRLGLSLLHIDVLEEM